MTSNKVVLNISKLSQVHAIDPHCLFHSIVLKLTITLILSLQNSENALLPFFCFTFINQLILPKLIIQCLVFIILMQELAQKYSLRTWNAVILCFGSEVNIFLTRSLAPDEIVGHGSLVKSMWPRKIALNIPCSDSVNPISLCEFKSF